MEYINTAILIMEIIGTIAFSASGTLVAIHKGMDLFGTIVLGALTAVGGGMIRDIIIQIVPKALMYPLYIIIAAATSVALFAILYVRKNTWLQKWHLLYNRIMFIMDSIGLGTFTAVGVITGIECGYSGKIFLLVFLGTVTGVGGGLLRDVVAQQEPYILTRDVYACASITGALCCVFLYRLIGEITALVLSSLAVVIIRCLATIFHWSLPNFGFKS